MASEWSQWQRITACIPPGKGLYRAAGPNVVDSIRMTLTPTAIDYLLSLGIDGVFCIGTWPFLYPQPENLQAKGIEYKWMTVQNSTPSLDLLEVLWNFFVAHKSILVYDGDGKWRSGMGITAIQLYLTGGTQPTPAQWKKNGIESQPQVDTLISLRAKLRSAGPPPNRGKDGKCGCDEDGKGDKGGKGLGGRGRGKPDWWHKPHHH